MNNSLQKHRLCRLPFLVALLGCCAAFMLSSCSKQAGNAIVGKWQVEGEKSIVEFKADGTVINDEGGAAATGKYTFSDATHMKIEMAMPKEVLPPGATAPASVTVNCVVKINGDDLDMDVTVNIPGETQTHKDATHLKRIK